MDKILKGNYDLITEENIDVVDGGKDTTQEFEERSLERLGGSIAFVMKGKRFIWDAEDK